MADRARGDDPLWYKDAIIYEVRVRAFYDQDGDGIGDLRGLTEKLGYLQDLGVSALWLLPFYPSPLRDDGYDISDYLDIHADVGTLADFKVFMRAAHERGLKVITELVLNHTSDQHALFERARRAPPGSTARNYFVWSDTPDRYPEARIIFKDFEHSNWAWDPVAKAYYWHRFYAHQPDLNFDNPTVRHFLRRVVDFWLELGVDGLRLDAVPYLFEREGTNCENLEETHGFLRELRRHVDHRFQSRMLLSEANQWPEDAAAYFGDGDESHMAFHFPIMPRLFMALQMEDRFPIIEIVSQTPAIPESCQWAVFLRNHDELTLEMVTDEERDYMYRVYAEDPQARINLGIRRRLAPLMRNDRRRIELMNAMLFALPGTPVIYYGDEIGMGDNIYLGDRNGVRTPMQWSADRNAGFSRANPQRLYLPVIVDPEYHFQTVNVETQQANPSSLLRWMQRLITLRKQYQAFGRGTIEFLYPDNPQVLTFVRRHGTEAILVVANLSRSAQYVELDLHEFAGMTPLELFGRTQFPPIGELPYLVTMGPHGFFWFALEPAPAAAGATPSAPLPVLAVKRRPEEVLRPQDRAALKQVLPAHLRATRWYAPEAHRIKAAEVVELYPLPGAPGSLSLGLAHVEFTDGTIELCVMPLALASGDAAAHLRHGAPRALIAGIPGPGGAETVLYDALWSPALPVALLESMGRRRRLQGAHGELTFTPLRAHRQVRVADGEVLAPAIDREQPTSTVATYGNRVTLRLFRRLEPGLNPDLEISRFLTERTSFAHTPPVIGAVEYRRGRGEPMTVALLRAYVPNEGDAWHYTLGEVQAYYERALNRTTEAPPPSGGLAALRGDEPPPLARELIGDYLEKAALIGRRTAELHLALCSAPSDPAFCPEPFSTLYRRSLYQSMRNRVRQTFQLLKRRRRGMSDGVRAEAERVLALEERALASCRTFLDAKVAAKRIRCQGRFRLTQLLYTGSDFIIADFEGDPTRSLSERRHKRSAMRDIASMVRSFQYAAFAPLVGPSAGGPVTPAELERREPWGLMWQEWTAAAFVRSYLTLAQDGGFLPTDRNQLRAQLETFLLEEAVFALAYELNHRPDWVRIPLYLLDYLLRE
ncbi:MAG TPA: maltose alpha-D-glucosyltransferase [Polyangia bacterium]|jgi:maltose alpha-D-glucosyltransferase/alpha-amylase